MRIETIDGIRYLTADDGYFITDNEGLYGITICLGENDSMDNYIEVQLSEYPVEKDIVEEPDDDNNGDEVEEHDVELEIDETDLKQVRDRKLRQITNYDLSTSVNGFYYNGQFMWLDKATRVGLVNTLNSAEMLNYETINIWYDDEICITLEIEAARRLLAILEMYATQCYNVTAQHKSDVKKLMTIEEINSYDITEGYPEMLRLGE